MSFDARTGHFILTISKARLAFHVDSNDTESIAACLQESGIKVHEVCPAWVRCDMRPAAIWKTFHAEEPGPSRIAHYWTRTAQELYPEWAEGELSAHAQCAHNEPVYSC